MPSTAVRDLDYDAESETLWVTFVTSGRRYAYAGVPLETYDAFRHSTSKGLFFNRHIRDRFDCELIYDPQRPGPTSPTIAKSSRSA